jgi:hypothetical protein
MTTPIEALILLPQEGAPRHEEVEAAITSTDGRIVAGFLPVALIAQVTTEGVEELRRVVGAAGVYTEAIPASVVETAAEPLRSVLAAWNQRRSPSDDRPEPRGRGLAWDAPGFLPPDPPPEIRALLRQREQQYRKADDSSGV